MLLFLFVCCCRHRRFHCRKRITKKSLLVSCGACLYCIVLLRVASCVVYFTDLLNSFVVVVIVVVVVVALISTYSYFLSFSACSSFIVVFCCCCCCCGSGVVYLFCFISLLISTPCFFSLSFVLALLLPGENIHTCMHMLQTTSITEN